MISTHYRNKRLGDFLKELGLAEGRNTGIPKICKEMEMNGSEPPRFMTDEGRTYMRVVLPIHEAFREEIPDLPKNDRKNRRSSEELTADIVDILNRKGCLRAKELADELGYKNIGATLRNKINELLEDGTISYLHPESPQSPKQRLCLNRK